MGQLGIPLSRPKTTAGWPAEKAGRLKLNGRLLRRSPLSGLVELEMMHLAVEGEQACRRIGSISQVPARILVRQ